MMSMASGNCAPNFFCRRPRRNLSTRNGSTRPENSAAIAACEALPSKASVPPKEATTPMPMNTISLPKPSVRPDCSSNWLRLISGSRYSPPDVSPRSRRNCDQHAFAVLLVVQHLEPAVDVLAVGGAVKNSR